MKFLLKKTNCNYMCLTFWKIITKQNVNNLLREIKLLCNNIIILNNGKC